MGLLSLLSGKAKKPAAVRTLETPGNESGWYKGRHYTTYVKEVTALLREEDDRKAEHLLLELVGAVEREARSTGYGVPPWYYEHLAIIYRKRKDYRSEVGILERYRKHKAAAGVGPSKLAARLTKARAMLTTTEKQS